MSDNLKQLSDFLDLGYFCKYRSQFTLCGPNAKSDIKLTLTKDDDSKVVIIKYSEIEQANSLLKSHDQSTIC